MDSNISLSELQQLIKNAVYIGTPDVYWVVAEVSEIKINNFSGHCYLELVEKEETGESFKAKIRAIIWRNKYLLISDRFENETGSGISIGAKILIKARVEYHELYGISLSVIDIDPSFTIGDMEVRRREIIKQLSDEGVLNMNKELSFPVLPQRIAVISSVNAAGYTDFYNHLRNNAEGYSFMITLFSSVMQGDLTEKSILESLDRIGETLAIFDLVVIIRGGGSKSDLAWFDNYNIAYYITQFPIPVLTGIGHDKDISITDIVAFQSFKTPTAVADYLIDAFLNIEEQLFTFGSTIREIVNKQIKEANKSVDVAILKLRSSTAITADAHKTRLSSLQNMLVSKSMRCLSQYYTDTGTLTMRLHNSSSYLLRKCNELLNIKIKTARDATNAFIKNREADLRITEKGLKNLHPANVLKRGYTISYKNGIIVKNVTGLAENDIIETHFRDGNISSEIKKITKKKDE